MQISAKASAFSITSLLSQKDEHCEKDPDSNNIATTTKTIIPYKTTTTEPNQSKNPIRMSLENRGLWDVFHSVGTEMVITKSGRRMFPAIKISVDGLDPTKDYVILLDVASSDNYRYKYHESEWLVTGKAYPDVSILRRTYIHPESPCSGAKWMSSVVSFHKLKITNNVSEGSNQVILNSLHKYQPRIHVIQTSSIDNLSKEESTTFIFPETAFMAVTAYQSEQITQLKIDNNPFAKGFRDPSPCDLERMRFVGHADHLSGYHNKFVHEIADMNARYRPPGYIHNHPMAYPMRHMHVESMHNNFHLRHHIADESSIKNEVINRHHPMKRPHPELCCYPYEPATKSNRHRFAESAPEHSKYPPNMVPDGLNAGLNNSNKIYANSPLQSHGHREHCLERFSNGDLFRHSQIPTMVRCNCFCSKDTVAIRKINPHS